jgi:hypothetical protein
MIVKHNVDYGKTVRIPDGTYEAVYVAHEIISGSWGKKVRSDFRLVTLGEYFEQELCAWYNIADGGDGLGGWIKLSAHHKLTNELYTVLELKVRVAKLCPSMLNGCVILVKVVTVKQNGRKELLAEPLWYSKVECMISRITIGPDACCFEPVPIPNISPQSSSDAQTKPEIDFDTSTLTKP